MEQLATLRDLFLTELNDAYSAEKQMIEALPKMAQAASSQEVKKDFQEHLSQTRQQASRLEEVFQMLHEQPEGERCEGMAGIVRDGEKAVKAHGEPHVKDAALIAAAQKAEHYEIATYGTLRALAETIGEPKVAEKLAQTLSDEKSADKRLTGIATKGPNAQSPK